MELVRTSPAHPPRHSPGETDAYLGLVIALGGLAMLFAALLFACGVLRLGSETWPPAGTAPLPLGLPLLATLLLLASGGTAEWARRSERRPKDLEAGLGAGALRGPALATLLLGAGFLVVQVLGWRHAWQSGLGPGSGSYGAIFCALTAVHAAHVLGGLGAWLLVLVRQRSPRLVTLYWHFASAVWLAMFVVLYVV